jgi:hypothetical protein
MAKRDKGALFMLFLKFNIIHITLETSSIIRLKSNDLDFNLNSKWISFVI